MRTDIAGSTPRFRALLASDLQALLVEHRASVAGLAADHGGRIFRAEGDGYWLEFPSVTGAAKSALAMQEALRLTQANKGDRRLTMRVVIGLGDVTALDGDLVGEALALVARIEAVTPPGEIYLTSAAHLTLVPAEVQTALVGSFPMQGFAEPISMYRIMKRHRTHVIADAYILFVDLRGFTKLTQTAPVETVERVLDTLDTLTNNVARELEGTVRFSHGDSYLLTFSHASHVLSAAERLSRDWKSASHEDRSGCGIHIALHRGTINSYRSFLYGDGIMVCARVIAHPQMSAESEGGIFVTNAVRDELPGNPWHNRLRSIPLEKPVAQAPGLEIYRLDSA